eukprot:TRINITY_DN22055_c0_g1_i1.p1 TRINITY_DN22055_c0_g1~~TRINITY_DN22055_c0_g1_i1.p1  ORF type:complete len:211 (-),score=50.39 TRINITY_DN22055_c0_g1_i1:28-600(-)
MEVQLLEADGLPADSLITFKVGSERKQSKLELGTPRRMHSGTNSSGTSCTVNIMRSLANTEITLNGGKLQDSAGLTVSVRKADGQNTEVQLKSAPLTPRTGTSKATEQAKDMVQALMTEVLREQPLDPYTFMVQRLRAHQEQLKTGTNKDSRLAVDLDAQRASRKALEGDESGRVSVTDFVRDEVMRELH